MHVALNAVHLDPGETGGMEVYTRCLVPALLDADPTLQLTVLAGTLAVESLRKEGWQAELLPVNVDPRNRVRGVLAEQLAVPRVLRRLKPDLLHNLLNTAPARPGVPQVTSIHDLIYRTVPETHAGLRAWGLRALVPLAARRSERILAGSQATADDITRLLGVASDRIDIVPYGAGSPPGQAAEEGVVRQALGLNNARIVLAVSAKRPHKNLERLVEAIRSIDATLVVPGYRTAFEQDLSRLAERRGVSLRLPGWLESPMLEGLYRAADCFVLPSLAEGFGLPVLEAMARGTPVACSDIPPLREVAGDAAVYFEPTDPKAIEDALKRVLNDSELRDRLQAAGPPRAAQFSWSRTAQGTIASYERASIARR